MEALIPARRTTASSLPIISVLHRGHAETGKRAFSTESAACRSTVRVMRPSLLSPPEYPYPCSHIAHSF